MLRRIGGAEMGLWDSGRELGFGGVMGQEHQAFRSWWIRDRAVGRVWCCNLLGEIWLCSNFT